VNKILLLLTVASCAALIGCGAEEGDTVPGEVGVRTVLPRVSGEGRWRPCRRISERPDAIVPAVQCGEEPPPSCPPRIARHKDAMTFLARCPGDAVEFLKRIERPSAEVKSDLSAAYYVLAQQDGRVINLLYALRAADEAVLANGNLVAAHFNRALAQEALRLNEEAIASLLRVQRLERDPRWAGEALRRQNALVRKQPRSAGMQWLRIERRLRAAHDTETVSALIGSYPYEAQMFAETVLLQEWADRNSRDALELTRLIGQALERSSHERYLLDVVRAIDGARGEELQALKKGHRAFSEGFYLLETMETSKSAEEFKEAANEFRKTGSAARYHAQARWQPRDYHESPYPIINVIQRISGAFDEIEGSQYTKAAEAYKAIAETCRQIGQPERRASAEARLSGVLRELGQRDDALLIGLRALRAMDEVPSPRERTAILSEPAAHISELGFQDIARRLRDAHIASLQAELGDSATNVRRTMVITRSLAHSIRARGKDYAQLGEFAKAKRDLEEYMALTRGAPIDDEVTRGMLEMQWLHVLADTELRSNPAAALRAFSRAIDLTRDGKFRAMRAALFLGRAKAFDELKRPAEAKRDVALALEELEREELDILTDRKLGEFERVWSTFLSRNRDIYEQLVRYTMKERKDEAFGYADRARAFEPLMLLLQKAKGVPAPLRAQIEKNRGLTLDEIQRRLDPGTFLLEYMVMEDQTLVWVVSRDKLFLHVLPVTRRQIEIYADDMQVATRRPMGDRLSPLLDEPYRALIEIPYKQIKSVYKAEPRLVFISDSAMQGMPLAALRNPETGRHLMQDAIVEAAGSATLYVYSLDLDANLPRTPRTSVLLILDPRFDPTLRVAQGMQPLEAARTEEQTIGPLYPVAKTLKGSEATVDRFIAEAPRHTVIHFSGHGKPNAEIPTQSMLLFAPTRTHNGVLEAQELLTRLDLQATRLVILAACSSAGGTHVGPEGVAPLVRPLVAAGVPAVIGTLWDVEDSKASALLVRFHDHYYRLGEDAALALREAQLDLLESGEDLLAWAPFQVVGHASSPNPSTGVPKNQTRSH